MIIHSSNLVSNLSLIKFKIQALSFPAIPFLNFTLMFSSVIDSSGMRIFYTSELRPTEIGLFFTGHQRTPFLSIPPKQKAFKVSGFCSSDCTQNVTNDMLKFQIYFKNIFRENWDANDILKLWYFSREFQKQV